jgi:transcriptional regulator with GAF, ATPase, and Fis domain
MRQEQPMRRFIVASAEQNSVEYDAPNWVVALGLALDHWNAAESLERLAVERLANGTLIAKDLRGGGRYVVRASSQPNGSASVIDESKDALASWLTEIDEASDTGAACRAAVAAAQIVIACDGASVLQLEETGLRFVAASGPVGAELIGKVIPSDVGAAGFSVTHRQIMVLYDAGEEAGHFSDVDRDTGYETRNLCCVPVMVGDDVLGVLEVINVPSSEPFHAEAMKGLERVAHRLAVRLSNGGAGAWPRLSDPSEQTDPDFDGGITQDLFELPPDDE